MPFSSISTLTTFVDSYLNTNGTDSITGAQLNTGLNGIIQFLGTAGAPLIGTYTVSVTTSGQTIQSFTIPLDFTPQATIVQSTNVFATPTNVVFVVSSAPTTNGITVYCESALLDSVIPFSATFSYIAI